jgi:hypothetical protein
MLSVGIMSVIMLSVGIMSVIMLSVVWMCAVVLNVVAPFFKCQGKAAGFRFRSYFSHINTFGHVET